LELGKYTIGKEAVMERNPCVYILSNTRNGTLYTGVTSNLPKRIWEHKNKITGGFTARYGIDRLVWYEMHESMESAITREKAIKRWNRAWKIRMIEEMNPQWQDMYQGLM
jgi:putative endonuclease